MEGICEDEGGHRIQASLSSRLTVGGMATPVAWKDLAANSRGLAPEKEPFPLLFDFDLLQALEVADHLRPLQAPKWLRTPSLARRLPFLFF